MYVSTEIDPCSFNDLGIIPAERGRVEMSDFHMAGLSPKSIH